ncbi:MAG TPA: divergent PAP2 family protein [Anaerolineales bacterium]|nr:divergent PAP2 family protein [Anaerolineales bacterium]
MNFSGVFANPVLLAALGAWGLAQAIKIPLEYVRNRRWDFALLFRAGGMPSSHSALVAAATHSIGLFVGFYTPLYALAFVVAMIVIYDATGIRRQAGMHAEIINAMIKDLASGHPLREQQLREVLGHTPMEALAGTILGILLAHALWLTLR